MTEIEFPVKLEETKRDKTYVTHADKDDVEPCELCGCKFAIITNHKFAGVWAAICLNASLHLCDSAMYEL